MDTYRKSIRFFVNFVNIEYVGRYVSAHSIRPSPTRVHSLPLSPTPGPDARTSCRLQRTRAVMPCPARWPSAAGNESPPPLAGDELRPRSPATSSARPPAKSLPCNLDPGVQRPPIPWVHPPFPIPVSSSPLLSYCCLISLVRTSSSSVHSWSTLFLHFLISCCLIFFVCSGWCLACLQIRVDGVSFFHSRSTRSTLQLAVLDESETIEEIGSWWEAECRLLIVKHNNRT